MGRRLPKKLSPVGQRIAARADALGLDLPSVAAAAEVASSTLYRIMGVGRKRTAEPRLRTKRRLARALRLPMSELFDDEQFELLLLADEDVYESTDEWWKLIRSHVEGALPQTRTSCWRAALRTLLDLELSLNNEGTTWSLGYADRAVGAELPAATAKLFSKVPEELKRFAAALAISAMITVELAAKVEPGLARYSAIRATRRTSASHARAG